MGTGCMNICTARLKAVSTTGSVDSVTRANNTTHMMKMAFFYYPIMPNTFKVPKHLTTAFIL